VPDRPDTRYQPLALITLTLVVLLGFAMFFLSFLVAPLAILTVFYLGFTAADRARRAGNGRPAADEELLAREALARRETLERPGDRPG
jgi:small-conductance mechanosensitive channel